MSGDLLIPNSMKIIYFGSFSYCLSLNGTLTISSSVEQIEDNSFFGTNFSKITFLGKNEIECTNLIGFQDNPSVYVPK